VHIGQTVIALPLMRVAVRLGVVVLAVVALAGCSRPAAPRTADELRTAIEDYKQGKPEATQERIEALFARLDAEIATQRADAAANPPESRDAAAQEVATLEQQRRDLQQAWIGARLARAGATAGEVLRGLGESLGRGMEDAGRRLRESMQGGNDQPPPGE
jgi:hypothetical protein